MYLSGVSFYVLSDHFLIHQSHTYEEEARKIEVSAPFFAEPCALQIVGQNSAGTIARYTRTSRRKLASGFSHHSKDDVVLTRHAKVSQAFFRSRCSQHDTREQCPRGVQENQGDWEDCHAGETISPYTRMQKVLSHNSF